MPRRNKDSIRLSLANFGIHQQEKTASAAIVETNQLN
ncbi:MAG: hypothetical protein ACJAVI_005567 [Candidatus Azotimanducaceae bacterium]|jgi:hypothetical protein